MKAFDKIWHNGLIYKLHQLKIPNKIGNWIKEFLKNRRFCVKVNDFISNEYKIETSVQWRSYM
jgi:predicted transglutaminase-like protease